MAINEDIGQRASDSASMLEYWDLTDDIVAGHNAMVAGGEKYLPKMEDEEPAQYKWRAANTKFTNIYRDIVESLAAKPFEQESKLLGDDIPEELQEFVEDVDGDGQNLTGFAAQAFFNAINSSVHGILVDMPAVPVNPNRPRTRAEERAANLRPSWSHVLGRNVYEASSKIIGGKRVWTTVRIFEPGDPNKVRKFIRTDTKDSAGRDVTTVRWELYREQKDGNVSSWILEDSGFISIGVIPFVLVSTGRRNGSKYQFHPPMRDAADLQKTLFQDESALQFAKRMGGYSMLVGEGVRPPMDENNKPLKLKVGPTRVLYAPPDGNGNNGTWKLLEPSATVLDFLKRDIKETMDQLRELGRQPLTAQSGNLTVITTAVAAGKAKSAVKAWGLTLKNSLENAFVLTCKFMGINTETYDPEVFVYLDFDEFIEGTEDLDTLNTARENGDISHETYCKELQRRGVLSPEFNYDDDNKLVLKEQEDEREDLIQALPAIPPASQPNNPAA